MRALDPADLERAELYALINSIVVPRPIAWVSSVNDRGTPNLAPHSYTTIASVNPLQLLFVSIGDKDTVKNVRATRSFVVHGVDRRLAEHMNVSASDAPADISEFELSGLTPLPSRRVPAPRVAEAPIALECELDRIVELGSDPSFVVIGTVVALHVAERLFDAKGRVDAAEFDAIARMGGALYSTTADRFTMIRPTYESLTTPEVKT